MAITNNELVQHLAGLADAKVEVRLEPRAESTSDVPDNIVRTVTENCRTLKFDAAEFEQLGLCTATYALW